jgi:Tat protein secretion system quality control protein TatD with DNase activity
VPHRGEHNTPQYIPLIVEAIASELKIDNKHLSEVIFNNTKDLFKI